MSPAHVVLARLPVEPLFEVLGAHAAVAEDRHGLRGVPSPVAHVAQRVGVNPRSVHRWIELGGVSIDVADRVAVAVGRHPAEVWGEAWWAACWEHDRLVRVQERERAELVAGSTAVERARVRGGHRSALDGCCASRNAARNDLEGVA